MKRPRLSTQIVLLQLVIIVLTVSAGLVVSVVQARRQLDRAAGRQSLTIAQTVAGIPAIRRAFATPDPARDIDPIAERIRKLTGASFVVVANKQGVRYSHPNPALIGQRLTDGAVPLSGRTWVGVENGSLGRSMRAKVPLRDDFGDVIGLVSVGVTEKTLSAELRSKLPVILIPSLLGLLLGAVGSVLLARRIKRQTFGLEPDEIAALLEQREAMLHGIREGAIATDASGRITVLNDEAERLLGLDSSAVGRFLDEAVAPGRLRDVLLGKVDGPDQVVIVGERVLLANRMPVDIRGRVIGAVVTLRDRTELEGLMRELDDVRSLAEALRAQEHDFSHRLHVIGGLIDLGRYDEAVQFITRSAASHQKLAASLVDTVGDPILVALLLGKSVVASERGVALTVSASGTIPDPLGDVRDLVTVLGNLIDNAIESVAGSSEGHGHIDVSISADGDDMILRVHDSGPGIDPALADEIFRDGFTTKVAGDGGRRGLGLALVAQAVKRRGGSITVENVDGALFTVTLPLASFRARRSDLEHARS